MIEDCYERGEERPLIIIGGPAAKYEANMFFGRRGNPQIGVDVAVTGEAFVGLQLEERILEKKAAMQRGGQNVSMREAFQELAKRRELDEIPGLMYRWTHPDGMDVLIDTHVQRLVRDLSEYPSVASVFLTLEPPHKGRALSAEPLPPERVKEHIRIPSLMNTRGCRINCDYCPIPQGEGSVFRTRGSHGFILDMMGISEITGITGGFGADDNVGNDLHSLIEESEVRAHYVMPDGRKWAEVHHWGTECTLTDLHRLWMKGKQDGRDYYSLLRASGLVAIWMGNEDVNSEVVRKGVTLEKVRTVLRELRNVGICPMIMNIYADSMEYTELRIDDEGKVVKQTQQFMELLSSEQLTLFANADRLFKRGKRRSSDRAARRFVESLTHEQEDEFRYGLREEAFVYMKHGAISQQFTLLTPAVGTNLYEDPYKKGHILSKVGNVEIEPRHFDGNHLIMSNRDDLAQRLRDTYDAYRHTYNFRNLFIAFQRYRDAKKGGEPHQIFMDRYAFAYQAEGILGRWFSHWRQRDFRKALASGNVERTMEPPLGLLPVLALHPASAAYYGPISRSVFLDPSPLMERGELTPAELERYAGKIPVMAK